MPATMMESAQVNSEDEWPRLDGSVPPEKASSSSHDDDWELLATDESHANEEKKVVVVAAHPSRTLRHCASSPDLRNFCLVEDGDENELSPSNAGKDDGSSFAMVSGPQSVVSFSSTVSFRDAILSGKTAEDAEQPAAIKQQQQQKRRFKPKFVVKPIQRCTKSTGDLLGMIDEDGEIMGDTDAMDYYYRKAAGARNRSSGMKLRPDEAKRKAMTLNKKAMQRRQTPT